MKVIHARNVQQAFPEAIYQMKNDGIQRDSRNGQVLTIPGPVTTVYEKPTERVLFWPERDANPFFHFFESLWMLAGRQDIAYLIQFVKRIQMFSDDGITFHGAYGFRWRHYFGKDQIPQIIEALKKNPEDRRQVLGMWDPVTDHLKTPHENPKDLPCNTHIYFSIGCEGRLDMTVCCRSNDIIWGCYGANAVHFSFLQEYMAGMIGVPVGIYWQMSNNWHAYLDTFSKVSGLSLFARDGYGLNVSNVNDPYEMREVIPFKLIQNPKIWDGELKMFLEEPDAIGYQEPFFRRVAIPLWRTFKAFKMNNGIDKYLKSLDELDQCAATDWSKATREWIQRRYLKHLNKQEKELHDVSGDRED